MKFFNLWLIWRLELLIRMRLHIWYYIKLKPKPSFGIHVATNCICNKSVCYNFNEFGEGVGINTHIIYSGAGILLRVKLHGCVFIAGTKNFLVFCCSQSLPNNLICVLITGTS
ncbi:hypothetical protein LXL04_002034 [Taraxacum kok-saghyz]